MLKTTNRGWLKRAGIVGAVTVLCGALPAMADTCPIVPGTPDENGTITNTVFTLVNTAPGGAVGDAACLKWGSGNLEGNGDPINDLGYTTLDKSDDSDTGIDGALIFTPPESGTQGTWSIDLSKLTGYTDFVVALKSGEGQNNPTYGAFTIGSGTAGEWTITSSTGGTVNELSHANLYGKPDGIGPPANVPLPASAWLFGTALLGLTVVARRKAAV